MIFKRNAAASLPVILIDNADFLSPETSVASGSVTVKYAKESETALTTFGLDGSKWTELGQGLYLINFSGSELNTNGKFIYTTTASGILPYFGMVEIRDNTTDSLGTSIISLSGDVGSIGVDAAAIMERTDNLPNDPTSEAVATINADNILNDISGITMDLSSVENGILDLSGDIDIIMERTDNLPDDPSSEANATINTNVIIDEINDNEEVIDYISGALVDGSVSGITELISGIIELNETVGEFEDFLESLKINITTNS